MSYFTDARDSTLKSMGLDTGKGAAQNLGNLTAAQIAAGQRGGASQVSLAPAQPSDANSGITSGGGSFISSISTKQKLIAAAALVAVLFFMKKRRR